MSIAILGMGWFTNEACGCVRRGLRESFGPGDDPGVFFRKSVFLHPFKNFGRMDSISKTTSFCVGLALKDAGLDYSPDRKQEIGIIGTSGQGSLPTDQAYFKDYIDGGRTLSRGNLFIYTLPSSSLGESAIHFGLQGPMLYVATIGQSFLPLLDMAASMVGDEAIMMLVGRAEQDEGVFMVLGKEADNQADALCSLSDARKMLASKPGVSETAEQFSSLFQEKSPA